jgi:hypothetical protein
MSSQVDRLQRNLDDAHRNLGSLQAALESNRRIGIAVGILMTRLQITDEAAFDLLRRASNDRNVKLRVLAEEVIYTGELDAEGDAQADGMHRGPADLSTTDVADEGRADAVRDEGPP